MKRRAFISLLGGAAAWPLAARAQQPAMPVIGFLNQPSSTPRLEGFRRGLSETGYVEGRNVLIEYRWAEGQADRLPALAADLVRWPVSLIASAGVPAVRAAQTQTTTIPIVFIVGEDPVKEGLVANLNRPGANSTGVSSFSNQLFAKRLQLLHEIAPKSAKLALLVNPNNPNAEPDAKDAQAAVNALGRELQVLTARTEDDFEGIFAGLRQREIGGLAVGVDFSVFLAGRERLTALAARYAVPAIYDRRDFPTAGGLMSYGAKEAESDRQWGLYAGRILKGEKPGDLPVQQSTKFEFVINLKTVTTLGLTIPPGVLAIADEVIE
jgi:putative tryptophan/tyrosine transport system substrate-binding protein